MMKTTVNTPARFSLGSRTHDAMGNRREEIRAALRQQCVYVARMVKAGVLESDAIWRASEHSGLPAHLLLRQYVKTKGK